MEALCSRNRAKGFMEEEYRDHGLEAPRRHPEGTQGHPGSAQEASRRHAGGTQEAPRGPQKAPRDTQEAARRPERSCKQNVSKPRRLTNVNEKSNNST